MTDDTLKDYLTTPGAAPEDVGAHEADRMRETLNNSLYAFCWLIMGFQDIIPTLHGQLCAYIQDWGQAGHDRIITQIPRDMYKTSVGSITNALWQICKEPHLPVVIFNEKADNAKDWLGAIRRVAAGSKLFQAIYRDLLPPGVHFDDSRSMPRHWAWSGNGIDFEGLRLAEPERSISAHGIESATTGHHWPKMILDDLISVKAQQSEVEMDRARNWCKTHLALMRPAEAGMCYVNCTPWTYTDIYTDFLKKYGYKLYRRSGLEDKDGKPSILGESIFPQKMSTEKLRKIIARDPFTGFSQYMCIPRAGEEMSFSVDWIRHGNCDPTEDEPTFHIEPSSYDPSIAEEEGWDERPWASVPLRMMRIEGYLDPAPSEPSQMRQEPHARNAMIVYGIDCWGRRYALESWAGREDYMSVIRRMFCMGMKWGFDAWRVEEVNFSNVYRYWIQYLQEPGREFSNQFMTVYPLKPKRMEKHTRIRAQIPYWRQGLWYINRARRGTELGEEWNEEFMTELVEYPHSMTNDLMDAMGYTKETGRPETPYEAQQRYNKEWSVVQEIIEIKRYFLLTNAVVAVLTYNIGWHVLNYRKKRSTP